MKHLLDIRAEVADALSAGQPVVALELYTTTASGDLTPIVGHLGRARMAVPEQDGEFTG